MPEAPARDHDEHPEPTLQATALRYAAGDLAAAESDAFEARLGHDQAARDALAEAVRLSAAALGQEPPAPHRSFRAAIRERLSGWRAPALLSRRAYRGHPLAWAMLGAVAVAACTVAGLSLADREPTADPEVPAVAIAPDPRPAQPAAPSAPAPGEGEVFPVSAPAAGECGDHPALSVAEIWANLSTPDHVERSHDEEMKWRQKLRDAGALQPVKAAVDSDKEP